MDILPALTAAARQGAFQHPPKLPYYAWRAQLDSDKRNPYTEPAFEYPDGPPKIQAPPSPTYDEMRGRPLTPDEKKADPFYKLYESWSFPQLKMKMKEIVPHVKFAGLSRADMGRVLHDHNVSPEFKPDLEVALQESA